ncbi:hypothetical protein NE237_026385 [Protea cynaroides]|uniref:Uncharacterized protein n=1 Tax=Protea cynaroides TaxID=273540 RepID=A0A9Q0H8U6_9MAGN|nr:hypothetical protein NE237_026385 [Protea cynaroides]
MHELLSPVIESKEKRGTGSRGKRVDWRCGEIDVRDQRPHRDLHRNSCCGSRRSVPMARRVLIPIAILLTDPNGVDLEASEEPIELLPPSSTRESSGWILNRSEIKPPMRRLKLAMLEALASYNGVTMEDLHQREEGSPQMSAELWGMEWRNERENAARSKRKMRGQDVNHHGSHYAGQNSDHYAGQNVD